MATNICKRMFFLRYICIPLVYEYQFVYWYLYLDKIPIRISQKDRKDKKGDIKTVESGEVDWLELIGEEDDAKEHPVDDRTL